jgi:hypothetical protein
MCEAPISALDRTTSALERTTSRARLRSNTETALERLCDRAHEKRSSAPHVDRVSRVALAAIASCLRHGIPRAVTRDRSHNMRSSAAYAIERN